MRTAMSELVLRQPRSLAEALAMMREEPLVPIAGCTDVFVDLNFGTAAPRRYINLWDLDELRGIRATRGGLEIGALATWTEVISTRAVERSLPILAEAARQIGGAQIQNRGTVGGNLANASPAGDSLPVFAAANAVVVVQDVSGPRRIPFRDFYTGYRKTAMRPGELIVAVEVPRVEGRQWFRKVGTRAAQAISKIVMAGVRADGDVRIAIGSVAPTVIRCPEAERALAAGASIEDACARLAAEVQPIDDLRSTAAYRRRVCANLLARFWAETDPTARRRSEEKARRRPARPR